MKNIAANAWNIKEVILTHFDLPDGAITLFRFDSLEHSSAGTCGDL